jgi:hypothetical protein
MTFNQLITTFQNIADNHGQIKSFHNGVLSEVDLEKLNGTHFPLLYVLVDQVTSQYGQKDWGVNIIVADRVQSDLDDRNDVWSDTELIISDVINEFRHSEASQSNATYGSLVNGASVTCNSFTDRFDNGLTGWEAQVTIIADENNNLCLRP